MVKRTLGFGLGLVCACVFSMLLSATSFASTSGLPSFDYRGVAIDPADLSYNPTGEIIFPSIIKAADYIDDPLGTYYMYYAPHDAPGGISLAYSDSLNGPWVEYSADPIISNEWSPYYRVSHVSSPDVIWDDTEHKFFLYFHGENNKTRLATSTDGIHFNYEKVVVSTDMLNNVSETSYARVAKHTIPSKGNKYIMTFMGNNEGTRRIYLAWSDDGRNWAVQKEPLISPNSVEGSNLSGPTYFPWNGKNYVLYHASSGNIYATEVGKEFDQENHLGIVYDSSAEEKRSAAPSFITVDNKMYMFYEQGIRLSAELAYGVAYNIGENDFYEAESLPFTVNEGTETKVITDLNASGGNVHKYMASNPGNSFIYDVNVPKAGTYNVRIGLVKNNTGGMYQLSIDGVDQGEFPMDTFFAGTRYVEFNEAYSADNRYVEFNLRNVTFNTPGIKEFRFTNVGKNTNSKGYTLKMDYIKLNHNTSIAPPTVPANLTTLAGNGKVALNWSPVPNANHYKVKRSTTEGGPYTVIADNVKTTQYTDKNVVNGTTYYYVVSGVNRGGESGYSNQVSALPAKSPWNLINDNMGSYTAGWGTAGDTGLITQKSTYVNIVDNSAKSRGSYFYMTKKDFTAPDQSFTFKVRAKVNAPGTINEFTIRSQNYQIGLYLTYGKLGAAQNKASDPEKVFTLDTTVYHDYRVVVHSDFKYDLYVDGKLAWSGATSLGSGSDIVKIGGDSPVLANMDVDDIKMGIGEIFPSSSLNILEIHQMIGEYAGSGNLGTPLVKQLTNNLNQAEHQLKDGVKQKARKHMEDFLQHLNNKSMQKFVSQKAQETLALGATKLINAWMVE